MKRELAFFTCYGIEYVYDFLGKERIDKKIEELMNSPTMGLRLERIAYGDPNYGYVERKGVLWIFDILINSFFKDELDLVVFLYQKSKGYNENNYFEGGFLKEKWEDSLIGLDKMIARNPNDAEYWESQKITPYWIDYHYFISTMIKPLMIYKRYQADKEIETLLSEIYDAYSANSEKIIQRLKLDKILWSNNGLSNLVFTKMKTFYKWKGAKEKVLQIIEKEKNQGWRI